MKVFRDDYTERVDEHNKLDKQTVLDKKDIKLLALNESDLTRADILKMHVKNLHELGPRQKRQVFEKIQNQRAMHARKVFLKELNVIGWQFKNKTQNPDPVKASLEQVS
jgi:hypothetical protein